MTFRFQTAFRLQAVCVNHSNGLVTRSLETARSSGFLTRYTVRNISPFERPDVFNKRVTKSFERFNVSIECVTKLFERIDVSN